MEWLKRSRKDSKNQQHRGHWVWPDPQWSSSDPQDMQSSSPWIYLLKQKDINEGIKYSDADQLKREQEIPLGSLSDANASSQLNI